MPGKGEHRTSGATEVVTQDIEQQLEELLRQVREGRPAPSPAQAQAGEGLTSDELDALLSGMLSTPTPEAPSTTCETDPDVSGSASSDADATYDFATEPEGGDGAVGDELAAQIQELLDEARSIDTQAPDRTSSTSCELEDGSAAFEPPEAVLAGDDDTPTASTSGSASRPETQDMPFGETAGAASEESSGGETPGGTPGAASAFDQPVDDDPAAAPWPGPMPVSDQAGGTPSEAVATSSVADHGTGLDAGVTSSDAAAEPAPSEKPATVAPDQGEFAGEFESPTDIEGWSDPEAADLRAEHSDADSVFGSHDHAPHDPFVTTVLVRSVVMLGQPLNPVFRILNRPLARMEPENQDLVGYIGLLTVLVGGSLIAATLIR